MEKRTSSQSPPPIRELVTVTAELVNSGSQYFVEEKEPDALLAAMWQTIASAPWMQEKKESTAQPKNELSSESENWQTAQYSWQHFRSYMGRDDGDVWTVLIAMFVHHLRMEKGDKGAGIKGQWETLTAHIAPLTVQDDAKQGKKKVDSKHAARIVRLLETVNPTRAARAYSAFERHFGNLDAKKRFHRQAFVIVNEIGRALFGKRATAPLARQELMELQCELQLARFRDEAAISAQKGRILITERESQRRIWEHIILHARQLWALYHVLNAGESFAAREEVKALYEQVHPSVRSKHTRHFIASHPSDLGDVDSPIRKAHSMFIKLGLTVKLVNEAMRLDIGQEVLSLFGTTDIMLCNCGDGDWLDVGYVYVNGRYPRAHDWIQNPNPAAATRRSGKLEIKGEKLTVTSVVGWVTWEKNLLRAAYGFRNRIENALKKSA